MKRTTTKVRLTMTAAATQNAFNLPTNVVRLRVTVPPGGPIVYVDLTTGTVASKSGFAVNEFTPFDSGELVAFSSGVFYYATQFARASLYLEIERALT